MRACSSASPINRSREGRRPSRLLPSRLRPQEEPPMFKRPTAGLMVSALALALMGAPVAMAADKDPPPRVANGLAKTPPMGWNSWNKFACNIDEQTVRRMADAMASNGMKEAGYQYV